MSNKLWNPRFVAYAQAHGKTPEEMAEHDRTRFPGGIMAGFINWLRDQWARWDAENKHKPNHIRSGEEHAQFDRWLSQRKEQ